MRFASPLGAADDDPAYAPYLDITYGPRPTTVPPGTSNFVATPNINANDGASFIYGAAGTFGSCGSPSNHICSDLSTAIAAVAAGQTYGFGGQFIRFAAPLNCTRPLPAGYWNSTYNLMVASYNSAPRIIPVVDFLAPSSCPQGPLQNLDWHEELQNFVTHMYLYPGMPTSWPALYFEIGNEPDLYTSQYPDYSNLFAYAAAGLYFNLNPTKSFGISFPFYRILTGGVTSPTAAEDPLVCSNVDKITVATNAINAATSSNNPYGPVNMVTLGAAMHPYGYRGVNDNVWPNYTFYGHRYGGECQDLTDMNNTWMSDPTLSGKPLMYTEMNWTVYPTGNDPTDLTTYRNADGSYLADLFTYLYNHNFTQSPSTSPLRVMWYRGNDVVVGGQVYAQGIYDTAGGEKAMTVVVCPNNAPVNGMHNISNDYYWLRDGECHNP